ncbi:MAG: hypothetical protein ACOX9C_00845 [Kiritimatiellia bacterium]|jgi:hypothetical protein
MTTFKKNETRNSSTTFWSSLWIEYAVVSVVLISAFSVFSLMRMGAWLSFAADLIWAAYRIASCRPPFITRQQVKERPLLFLLAAICLISLLVGPHCFLDSYSYRIPQMLFWLQEGRPWPVPHVDIRINQMPYVWSFLGATFFLPFGERGIAIPNFISFLLLAGVLNRFAEKAAPNSPKVKWLVLIFMSAPVFVMGAATNDNVVTCVTFLMISLQFALLEKPSTRSIGYSALAFALCCGVKPQYATLAPLWALWFFFGKPSPVKQFKWLSLVVLVPLAILCSPLPTLGVNHFKHGSMLHPRVSSSLPVQDTAKATQTEESRKPQNANETPMIPSLVSLANQMFALPVNPLADKTTQTMRTLAEKHHALEHLDFHRQRVIPVMIPEVASFGFFTTLAFLIGLVLARKGTPASKVAAWTAAGALLLAIFITNPGTLGRSFIGFFLVMTPLALQGLARTRLRTLQILGALCFLSGFGILILNPARPLWPCETIAEYIPHPGIRAKLLDYAHYSKRQYGAKALMEAIPATHPGPIGAILYDGNPMVELWKPFSLKRKMLPYPTTVSQETLRRDNIEFLIVRHPALQTDQASLNPAFLEALQPATIHTNFYTSYMQKGDEPWFLLKLSHRQMPHATQPRATSPVGGLPVPTQSP